LALLPLFGLIFWLTAVIASGFPDILVLGVNVHGLNLTSFASDTNQRPAPLSLSVLDDAQQDANTASSPSPAAITSPSRLITPKPTPASVSSPSTTPPPTSTPAPTPTPTVIAIGSGPTPTPTSSGGAGIISGQVLDSQTRNPIVGATVSASPGGTTTVTDSNGNFSLTVAAGSYTVTASAPTYASASQSLTVKAGQKQTLVFKLSSTTAYGSLNGTVTDSVTQAPLVGATVTLSDGMIRTTDLNGNFSYSIVLNGTYTLTISAVGYVTQSQSVTVKAGHTTNVQVSLVHS
jgi:outer membrane biosynthesis protein TonB